MNTYQQIVRELAESDPAVQYQDLCCNFCSARVRLGHDNWPDCLWLRAKQAMETHRNGLVLGVLRYDKKAGDDISGAPDLGDFGDVSVMGILLKAGQGMKAGTAIMVGPDGRAVPHEVTP